MPDESHLQRLERTALVLTPDSSLVELDRDAPDFYGDLAHRFGGFAGHALIADHEIDADWTHWERHPKGDEFIYLLSGEVTVAMLEDPGEVSVDLTKPGDFVIVPKGVWHTARATRSARALFVTPGEGTEHAEDPRGA